MKRGLPVIPVLLPDAPVEPELPLFLQAFTWVDLRDGLTENGLKLLEWGITGRKPGQSQSTDEPPVRTPKRICMISSEYPPRMYGGLGEHVKKLSTALGDYTHVDIVLPANKKKYTSLSRRVYPRAITIEAEYDDPTSWLRFAQYVPIKVDSLAIRPDVIHCHDWVTVLGGIRCRWMLSIPLVYHIHLPNMSPLCSSIENLGLLCADLVTVNSEAMRDELYQRFQQTNIKVVENGVTTDEFVPSKEWPNDDGYILFVGRLVEQKGVEYLLRALLYVNERFQNIKLKIVGDGPCKTSLEMLARDLTISDQVEFLGKIDELERRVGLYQAARIVVIPSVYEPFGIIALEAMACQRPVVASRTGGLQEIVENRINGFHFEPKDYLDLAQWIMTLLSDENLRREMGKNGHEKVRNRVYQWPYIARRYIDFYNSLLDRKDIDPTIPSKAPEFKEQIVRVAKEIKPDLEQSLLNDLFKWMEKI